jgi:hypothetical protein
LTALCVGAALVAAGGDAVASVAGTISYAPQQGPVIAGTRLLYVPSGLSGPDAVTIQAAQDGRTSTIARLRGQRQRSDGKPFTDRGVSALIAADPASMTAIVRTSFSFAQGRSGEAGQVLDQTWAAGPDGKFAAISPACVLPRVAFPAIGGSLAVSNGSSCGALEVVDVVSGARRVLPPAAESAVEIAGPYIAWLDRAGSPVEGEPGFAVVTDQQGADVTRVPITFLNGAQRLTLDADGTLAVFGRLNPANLDTEAVAIARPGAPTPSTIRTPAGWNVRGAHLARGRLAMLLERSGARGTGEVVLTDVDGSHPRTILRGIAAYGQDGFAFDGAEVAAVVSRCDGVQLVRVAVVASATRPLGDNRCRLALERRPRWTTDGLRIAVSCRGLDKNCGVSRLEARLGGPHGTLLGTVRPDSMHFAVAVRRVLREGTSHRTTKVYLRATLEDGAGTTRPRSTTIAVPPQRH